MKNFYCALCLVFVSLFSHAQFAGAYAPSKWSTILSPGSTGSVNTASAPTSIIIRGSDGAGGTNVDIDYTVTAIATGLWSFHWDYHTNDFDLSPMYDPAGVLINGVFTQLTNNGGPIDQSGNFSQTVSVGDVIGFRVRATDNTAGDATFTISGFGPPAGTLPVVFGSFTGRQEDNQAVLNWSASSQETDFKFIIERSGNGTDFSKLDEVQAISTLSNYEYIDRYPAPGVNYYRILAVENDGKKNYSSIVPISFRDKTQLAFYPNPATDKIAIQFDAVKAGTETIVVSTIQGNPVKQESFSIEKGRNNIVLNISSLPKGVYFLKTTYGKVQSFLKL